MRPISIPKRVFLQGGGGLTAWWPRRLNHTTARDSWRPACLTGDRAPLACALRDQGAQRGRDPRDDGHQCEGRRDAGRCVAVVRGVANVTVGVDWPFTWSVWSQHYLNIVIQLPVGSQVECLG